MIAGNNSKIRISDVDVLSFLVPFDIWDPLRPEMLLRGRQFGHSELAHASQTLIVFNWGRNINVVLRLSVNKQDIKIDKY